MSVELVKENQVFQREVAFLNAVSPDKPRRSPLVLSREEIARVWPQFTRLRRLMLLVMYSAQGADIDAPDRSKSIQAPDDANEPAARFKLAKNWGQKNEHAIPAPSAIFLPSIFLPDPSRPMTRQGQDLQG